MATGTELLVYDLALSLMPITLLLAKTFSITTDLTYFGRPSQLTTQTQASETQCSESSAAFFAVRLCFALLYISTTNRAGVHQIVLRYRQF